MSSQPTASGSRFGGDTFELQEEFAIADQDGDGRLSFQEFASLLEGLDSGMSEEEMQIGFREVDSDRDHRISCAEFLSWWKSD